MDSGIRLVITRIATRRRSLIFKVASPAYAGGFEPVDKIRSLDDGTARTRAALKRTADEGDIVGLAGADER